MYSFGITDKGLKRSNNEDSILINDSLLLYIVADGMGGYRGGDIASKTIVEQFENDLKEATIINFSSKEETVEYYKFFLNQSVKKARDKIVKYANLNNLKTIGSTIVGTIINKRYNIAIVFHLGDSRAYLINNKCTQITIDHSMYEDYKKAGASEEQLNNIKTNVITKAIGNFDYFDLEFNTIDLENNDTILLCSDGVSEYFTSKEFYINYIKEPNINQYVYNLKDIIYKNGANDNLSIITINFN
jgi:protein phosphatase